MVKDPTLTEDFILTEEEKRSALWQRLSSHLDNELQRLRESNDRHQSENETALTRGRIRQLKVLMDIDREADTI